MGLPDEEAASGSSYYHYRAPAHVQAAQRNVNNNGVINVENDASVDDAAAAARRHYERYENVARRILFPDPNAPIGCQGDLSRQNEVNLLLEAAEERAKKYWNFDYDNYFRMMPGDPSNVKWQLGGVMPPPELRRPEAQHPYRQLGPRPYPY